MFTSSTDFHVAYKNKNFTTPPMISTFPNKERERDPHKCTDKITRFRPIRLEKSSPLQQLQPLGANDDTRARIRWEFDFWEIEEEEACV